MDRNIGRIGKAIGERFFGTAGARSQDKDSFKRENEKSTDFETLNDTKENRLKEKGALFGLLGSVAEKFQNIQNIHTQKIKEILKTAAVFSFTLLVSGASPMAGVYPFGIALVCAMSRLSTVVAALSGALCALFFTEENTLLYGAAALSVFFVRLALGGLRLVKTEHIPSESKGDAAIRDSPFSVAYANGGKAGAAFRVKNAFSTTVTVKMICALGGALTVGAGMLLTEGNLWYDIFAASFLAVAVPVLTFAFSAVGDSKYQPGVRKAGAASLGFAFFLAISPFTVGGMNVGVVLAFLLSMYTAVGVGITDGILFGLFSGMAMEPSFAPMYAVGAAATGALYCFSPGVASVCAAALGISWALYADGVAAFSSAMPEILLAAGIFYPLAYFRLLPEKRELFARDAVRDMYDLHNEEKLCRKNNRDAAERIKKISGAMSHMAKVFWGLSERLKAPSAADCDAICEAAFSVACISCSKRKICHARESFKDGRLLRLVSNSLKLQGRVSIDSFPESMQRGCPSVDSVAEEINREYRKFYESVVKTDKTSVIAEDYDSIAELIRETVCERDAEQEKNEKLTKKLKDTFDESGIVGERISVYGEARPRVFVRGLTVKDLSFGSEDIRKMVQECVGTAMTEPEMSIDYDRLNLYMECRKRFSFKYGHFSERAGGLEVNGDAVCSFCMPEEKFSMLICDGMGSGRDAALTARVSAIFLERMLAAGCPVATAIKLLNNFTRERRIECFSTIDLFIADPFTGKAEFIKSGAAPSFVLRENKLFKMECDTAPVGILKEVNAGSVSFSLQKGDYVIMISDGILPEEENSAWLYDILCTPGRLSKTPADAAGEILRAAREHAGMLRPDDATVGVVRIDAA